MDHVGRHACFVFGFAVGTCSGRDILEAEIELAVALGLPARVEPVHVAAADAEQRDRAHHADAPRVTMLLTWITSCAVRPTMTSKRAWLVDANCASVLIQLLKVLAP